MTRIDQAPLTYSVGGPAIGILRPGESRRWHTATNADPTARQFESTRGVHDIRARLASAKTHAPRLMRRTGALAIHDRASLALPSKDELQGYFRDLVQSFLNTGTAEIKDIELWPIPVFEATGMGEVDYSLDAGTFRIADEPNTEGAKYVERDWVPRFGHLGGPFNVRICGLKSPTFVSREDVTVQGRQLTKPTELVETDRYSPSVSEEQAKVEAFAEIENLIEHEARAQIDAKHIRRLSWRGQLTLALELQYVIYWHVVFEFNNKLYETLVDPTTGELHFGDETPRSAELDAWAAKVNRALLVSIIAGPVLASLFFGAAFLAIGYFAR